MLLAAASLCGCMRMYAEEVYLKSFRQAPSVSIPMPVTPVEPSSSAKFDSSSLLSARKAADYFHRIQSQDYTTVSADSTHFLSLTGADGSKAVLHQFTTRLCSPRFLKGKLNLKSNSMAEVFVDGKSVLKKSTSDSLPMLKSVDLTLIPERDVDLEIHILALPSDASAPTFSLSFSTSADDETIDLVATPDVARHFSINTTTLGERLVSTSISDDGKYILLNFSNTFGEGDVQYYSQLRLTDTGKIISTTLPGNARWMPGSDRLFFTERSADSQNLYTLSVPDMTRMLLAENIPAKASEITWAPDATWFIYPKSVDGKKDTGVMRRITDPDDRIPGNRNREYLMRYDLKSGISSPLTFGGVSTQLQDISSDSRKVLYMSVRETPQNHPFYAADFIQLDVATMQTDTLVRATGNMMGAVYSPDRGKILLWGGPNEFDGVGRNAGTHEYANDFDIQLYLYDIASKNITPLTKDFNPSVEGRPVWNSADGNIYFRVSEGFLSSVYTLNPSSGKISRLPLNLDYTRNFSIGRNEAKYLSACGMSYNYVGRGELLNLKTHKTTLLADPLARDINTLTLGDYSNWKFTASDGTEIDGEVILPPDFDSSRKYPLIVYYYAGTTPSIRGMHSPYAAQLFASYGYVVYVINPSGTIGYGQEFSARHVNAWGERTADDIIEGVKKFCESHPYVDSKKIGCIGASYGGFMTQLLQTKTDIFAAAVSHAGISNVASYWGEGYWGYSYNSVAAANSYPWTNPEIMNRGSLFNADKIHTPLLLLHGTKDTNVPVGESVQIFNALRILGRDVEFITVEDQNHIISDFNKRKLWHATIMAWFERWLKDDPSWWKSLYD